MDYKTWVSSCLLSFSKYDVKSLQNLLFSVKLAPFTPSEEMRTSILSILSTHFDLSEGSSDIWVQFLYEHLEVLSRKHQKFRHLNFAYQALVSIFKEDDEGYRLFKIVQIYSKKLLKEGTKSNHLDDVINSLRKLIGSCQNNQPLPNSHVIGLIFSINVSIKTCFRLNNLQQLTSLLRIVNNPHSRFPKLQSYPKAQQVELKFYEGKYFLYENNFEDSANAFELAYNKCKSQHVSNTKKILLYLVPLNALFGKFASNDLLKKFGLERYSELLRYVRSGNVSKVEEIIHSQQQVYLKLGMIILIDLLKFVAYKRLFLKVRKILNQNKISIEVFQSALQVAGFEEVTRSRVVSIFNSLACKEMLQVKLDLVKGFISF